MSYSEEPVDIAAERRREAAALSAGMAETRKPRSVRRREKIRDEIERNRRGEYTVPTWVLAAALVALVAAWAAMIFLT
jgi:hypothetical protein